VLWLFLDKLKAAAVKHCKIDKVNCPILVYIGTFAGRNQLVLQQRQWQGEFQRVGTTAGLGFIGVRMCSYRQGIGRMMNLVILKRGNGFYQCEV